MLPLPLADRLGATTLLDAVTAGSLSASLPPGHPLAASPAAIAFGGRVPERLSVERVWPDTDNVENRFVAGVLDACLRVVEQVARLARESKATGAPALDRDCAVVRETLWVLRSHRVLEPLRGHGPAPMGSTVLQRQPGYREVLAFWMDLLARTRWLPSPATSALLALRDAPTLYEYWCYFAVVAAVERAEGPPVAFDPVKQDAKLARVAWSAQARFASGVEVVFNQHFAGHGQATEGPRSSSVPLRPTSWCGAQQLDFTSSIRSSATHGHAPVMPTMRTLARRPRPCRPTSTRCMPIAMLWGREARGSCTRGRAARSSFRLTRHGPRRGRRPTASGRSR